MSLKKAVVLLLAVGILFSSSLTAVQAEAAKKDYTKRDVKLLASIIFCEAGNQSYAGKLAVGCVVMNRKRSHSFPNTVEGVIRQKRQFTPVSTGKFSKELKKYKKGAYKKGVRATCVKAAKEALSGKSYVKAKGKKISMRKYHFFSRRLRRAKLRIGAHDFK